MRRVSCALSGKWISSLVATVAPQPCDFGQGRARVQAPARPVTPLLSFGLFARSSVYASTPIRPFLVLSDSFYVPDRPGFSKPAVNDFGLRTRYVFVPNPALQRSPINSGGPSRIRNRISLHV
jgi:hypothetical protein